MFIVSKIRNRLIQVVSESGYPLGSGDQLKNLTPEQLHQIHQYFQRPKFFILGHPRSGTTLLGRLIGLHPEVYCNWNARFFNWDGLVARGYSEDDVEKIMGRNLLRVFREVWGN